MLSYTTMETCSFQIRIYPINFFFWCTGEDETRTAIWWSHSRYISFNLTHITKYKKALSLKNLLILIINKTCYLSLVIKSSIKILHFDIIMNYRSCIIISNSSYFSSLWHFLPFRALHLGLATFDYNFTFFAFLDLYILTRKKQSKLRFSSDW
jgi:hypothetical protein